MQDPNNVFYLADYRQGEVSPAPSLGSRALLGGLRSPKPKTISAAEDKLIEAAPILLYHVSWGRNAWQATWIAKYSRDTLCPTQQAARNFVDQRKLQGSAFRLLVTPGWYLQFSNKRFLICEINTDRPFARLNKAGFLEAGSSREACLVALNPSSSHWRGVRPPHDSVIVQETSRPVTDFVKWADRTESPGQTRTPGRYSRKIDGSHWWFSPTPDSLSAKFDTSFFVQHLPEAFQ